MVKKQVSKRTFKKLKKSSSKKLTPKNRYLTRYIWIICALVIIVISTIAYFTWPKNLGAQLPSPLASSVYKQENQPIDKRVQDLLSQMTLDEKIGQMALVDKGSLKNINDVSRYYLGGVLSGAGAKPAVNTPQGWLDMVSSIKNQATNSRLGIPILYGVDSNHGHSNVLGTTVFPHAIGLGASHDTNLVNQVAAATADELQATGVNWTYSPSLDAPKDIRWGRVYEAFSDSPSLNGELGAAYISGTQAITKAEETQVLATAKHYLGTGAMNWGQSNHKIFKIDQGKITPDKTLLANEYLPPYKAAVDANVASVMVGLNMWGNQRIIDSKYLITDKLKTELGFKGFVVSDWYGVYEYSGTSKYKSNVSAINAGLDMAMLPYDYKGFINDVSKAVKNGDINESRIDDAVSRILTQKFKAGLFDINSSTNHLATVGSQDHRQLARTAVAKSAVLLKNEKTLLPLSKTTQHILVAGTGANNVGRQSGGWTVEWQGVDGNWMPGGTSILQGIRQLVASSSVVDYSLTGNFATTSKKADVAIVVVSEKPYAEGWGDNANPTIEPADLAAINKVKLIANKVVVIMVSGRPLIITDQIPKWDAAVVVWLPGSEGAGVADVLFGNKPFTGKLPLPWPASIQQLPLSVDGITNDKTAPLFTRGFGL